MTLCRVKVDPKASWEILPTTLFDKNGMTFDEAKRFILKKYEEEIDFLVNLTAEEYFSHGS